MNVTRLRQTLAMEEAMWATSVQQTGVLQRDLTSSDPRIGSARDNSSSASLSGLTKGTNSSSGLALGMTLLPISIISIVCLAIFVILRRLYPRVYAPRTFLKNLEPHERSSALPGGYFNWILPFWRVPDKAVLDHCSLDAFLFLRYVKILCVICLTGACMTWPILLPLAATGGNNGSQLDVLTWGNISAENVHRSYAYAVLAWIYFGFILYMISRECIYYIHLRQAYLLSPLYADRLSSRTVLFTCVPRGDLEVGRLRDVFGPTVKSIWISSDTDDLDRLVIEREQTVARLQKAEVSLIKQANLARNRVIKQAGGHPDLETGLRDNNTGAVQSTLKTAGVNVEMLSISSKNRDNETVVPVHGSLASVSGTVEAPYGPFRRNWSYEPPKDISGSVAAQWIPHEKRPSHRPLANYARRVDTIKWTRNRIAQLTTDIERTRKRHRAGRAKAIPAAFIEFESQADAQAASQTLAHHRACHMRPETVGIAPHEIIWSSLRLGWHSRVLRNFLVMCLIAVMIVFWSIPVAIVGIVSNIEYIASEVPFLHWLLELPSTILAMISGLLPAVAISFVMSLVPGLVRGCARLAGVVTLSHVELYTQNAYFVFQVVQVFLITTLTSAASAAVSQIVSNPSSAKDLLAQNLPKASNFYVSYFIVQGLCHSATAMVQFVSLVRDQWFLYSNGNPRVIARRWFRLRRLHWGAIYPVFTNMGVIAVTYSLIAPLILGFATIGLYPIYLSYKYNLLYVWASPTSSQTTYAFEPVHTPLSWRTCSFVSPDAQGLHYPRALKQTLVGLYLAEICLFGLFGLQTAFGPLVMMVGLIVVTALAHISLNAALDPLLYNLPRSLALAEARLRANDIIKTEETASKPVNAAVTSGTDFGDNPAYHDIKDDSAQVGVDRISRSKGRSSISQCEDSPADGYNEDYYRDEQGLEEDAALRAMEGLPTILNLCSTFMSLISVRKAAETRAKLSPQIKETDFWAKYVSPQREEGKSPNFVIRWLHPEVFEDYDVLRKQVPTFVSTPTPEDKYQAARQEETISSNMPYASKKTTRFVTTRETISQELGDEDGLLRRRRGTQKAKSLPGLTFEPFSMLSPNPRLWIPRDMAGVGKQEAEHCGKVRGLKASDSGIDLVFDLRNRQGRAGMLEFDFDAMLEEVSRDQCSQ